MCGIFFHCSTSKRLGLSPDMLERLKKRGPDSVKSIDWSIKVAGSGQQEQSDKDTLYLSITSTVLALRGASIEVQPLIDDNTGSMLCWNGEAWKIGNDALDCNDSRAIFSRLIRIIAQYSHEPSGLSSWESRGPSALAIKDILKSIQGPFSFLFYDAVFKRLFYGRDLLGRRSLLVQSANNDLFLSSIAGEYPPKTWLEVPANEFHEVDLVRLTKQFTLSKHDASISNPACGGETGNYIDKWTPIKLVFASSWNSEPRFLWLPSTNDHVGIQERKQRKISPWSRQRVLWRSDCR